MTRRSGVLFSVAVVLALAPAVACGDRSSGAAFDVAQDPDSGSGGPSSAFSTDGSSASCNKGSLDLTGCPCQGGQSQKCFVGNPSMAGVGSCTWGTQVCQTQGELSHWGPCTGYGTEPKCSGGVGPGDGGGAGAGNGGSGSEDGGATDGGKLGIDSDAAYCNEGGSVYVNNIVYGSAGMQGVITVCSGLLGTTTCGPTFGQGGTFSARCAGKYQVCARIVTTMGCNVTDGVKLCVDVTVPTDNATVPLPAFPGFTPITNACLQAICPGGNPAGMMSTSLDVTGTTNTGINVNRPNVATNIDPVACGGGGNGGSGGGSF